MSEVTSQDAGINADTLDINTTVNNDWEDMAGKKKKSGPKKRKKKKIGK